MANMEKEHPDLENDAMFLNGELCLICQRATLEPYGRPGACEDCGGDFVLGPKYSEGASDAMQEDEW